MDNHQNNNRELGEHNGSEVVLKNGKFGMYVTIDGKNTSVKYINKDMDDITLEDVAEYINKKGKTETNIIKRLNDDMSIRKGRYGSYVYYKTNSMNRPKFISMKGVAEEEITVSWVEARLND